MIHKDVVYHKLKKFERQELRKNPISKRLKLRDMEFTTLDTIFPGALELPVVHSGNLQRVMENQEFDVMAGICMMGYGRIAVKSSDCRFDLWSLPSQLSEAGDWDMRDYYDSFPKEWSQPQLDFSAAKLEPTLGRTVKIFNILEVASNLNSSVSFVLPTYEYSKVRAYNAKSLGIDCLDKLIEVHEEASIRYEKQIRGISNCYFPDVHLDVLPSHKQLRDEVKQVIKSRTFRKAVKSLGKLSYHQKQSVGKQFIEEELGYVALLLQKNGELNKDGRILVLNARDIDSFVLPAMYVYNELQGYNAVEKIAFIGVGGGPSITRAGKNNLMFPVDFQDANYDDYFGKAPTQVLSLEEDIEEARRKLELPHAERSNTSPIFSYLTRLNPFLGLKGVDELLDQWKAGFPDEVKARDYLIKSMNHLKSTIN